MVLPELLLVGFEAIAKVVRDKTSYRRSRLRPRCSYDSFCKADYDTAHSNCLVLAPQK